VEPRFVPGIIGVADACIVPHYVTEHTDTTVPNKVFDYMLQRKPVLVTQSRSLRQIVEPARCGIVYQDTDPDALAAAIHALGDRALRASMGSAGYTAVQTTYNWDRDKAALLNAVRLFATTRRSAARHGASRPRHDRTELLF
jgi:glycosyltransferase involved in cell wall biosynthesis